MKRFLLFFATLTSFTIVLHPSPTLAKSPKRNSSKSEKTVTSAEVSQDAHGWSYVKGEWVHPNGYKYVRGQVLRTTAKMGLPAPEPPGKLALENPQKLTPTTKPAPVATKTEAETKAEIRRKNLETKPAPQTGSHM